MLYFRHLLIWMLRIVHSKSQNIWVIPSYQLTTSHTHWKHVTKCTHQEVSIGQFSQSSPTKRSQTYTYLFKRQHQTLSYLLGHKSLTVYALYSTYTFWNKKMFIFSCGCRIFKPLSGTWFQITQISSSYQFGFLWTRYLIYSTTKRYLANTFMEEVALSFGMTSVIVVDADRKLRSVFEDMCTALKIHFWPLAWGQHKVPSVEKYHIFINKTQPIVDQDIGTHLPILSNSKNYQYAWNSAPIYNTYISQRLAALGREFRFLLDI